MKAKRYTDLIHWQVYISKNMSGCEIFLFFKFAMLSVDMEIYGQMVKTGKYGIWKHHI